MTVKDLMEKMELTAAAGTEEDEVLAREADNCYIGDLLSLAMSRVEERTVWITIQTNVNIIAVASLADAACVIIADGFQPDETTAIKAGTVGIPVLTSPKSAYELAKDLAGLGL